MQINSVLIAKADFNFPPIAAIFCFYPPHDVVHLEFDGEMKFGDKGSSHSTSSPDDKTESNAHTRSLPLWFLLLSLLG